MIALATVVDSHRKKQAIISPASIPTIAVPTGVPRFSLLWVMLFPEAVALLFVVVLSSAVTVVLMSAEALSHFARAVFAWLSLRLLASCLSRIRLISGGVPVVLSSGCAVSKISVTRSVDSSRSSTLSSHAASHSFR